MGISFCYQRYPRKKPNISKKEREINGLNFSVFNENYARRIALFFMKEGARYRMKLIT
jgi:hypothetical protein